MKTQKTLLAHGFRATGCLFAGLALWAGLQASVHAQTYPSRPVKAVVAYPPGGVNDILVRHMAPTLGNALGQPLVVENVAGANGVIGNQYAARATPDGYTILFSSTPLAINASLYPNLPFDTLRAFKPVSMILKGTFVMAVHPSVPARTAKEFIELARSAPGKYNFCSSGIGSPAHLNGELLKQASKTSFVHIPYRGAGPCISDLVGGKVEVVFEGLAPLLPHIQSGRLRALAVMGEARSPALPDVPTIAEATGLNGLSADAWYGVFVPANTPDAVVNTLHDAIGKTMTNADVAKRLAELGLNAALSTPDELAQRLRSDVAKWERVIKTADVKVDR
ncbi:Bug family tripartite tricarboxylate transporter substrate binding protein [Hydrogenophaga sp. BPS33]|uniref:Bug family tripartite tricarboxylate transporter substrate binding protein n=1 Tax=Hydrogenophaga sp. BPS33 TaxID=2651974 RepID=UPI00131FF6D6|nr:tripartite tricarboxylate transporter substrate binding protein [Hydrogenophaga sp. BPS33]QHE89310.1 tripartite tricarboxylate transporter substrate binding protein [Hydrogenophaga sp. BPS33]